ncbi:MAG TPA: UdgX family uracil-DNA binding protein [Bryobacteraceae bacterium]|nr:UdgX family uracil-DNA binding protein [Bryobacteraceae bacterium]
MPAQTITAADFIPSHASMKDLQEAVQSCRGCELYKFATRAVFGEGRVTSRIVLVGEEPGDEEDRKGHPFVGPAGRMLDRALEEAGIDRSDVYVSNAIKHFKFEERGKRRIHKKPSSAEITACKPWLEMEVSLIRPKIVVCLGASATRSILGPNYRLTKERGRFVPHAWAPHVTATIHPSAILRAPDSEARHAAYRDFVADLKGVKKVLEES